MHNFVKTNEGINFEYTSDYQINNEWIWSKLKFGELARISYIFYFEKSDLLHPPDEKEQDFSIFKYQFRFGTRYDDDYTKIPAKILDIKNDLLITNKIRLHRNFFAAERNISIFKKLSNLLEHSKPIVIGGPCKDAIPLDIFEELRKNFPNTYELNRYTDARINMILSDYLDGMKDARNIYENYLDKKYLFRNHNTIDLEFLKQIEIQKYIYIKDEIEKSLTIKTNYSEKVWQKLMLNFLLLLFPKYIKILENVTIPDYYSSPNRKKSRHIDLALIDANGNIDIIEIKKPFDNKILRKSHYRGNSIPTIELSGSIMQAEKYIFHLSKAGIETEKNLTKKYSKYLPPKMNIRISNPKAIIIIGRDQIDNKNMSDCQILDFEIIKRKYANMIDIITYDDLLRRLNNMIAALKTPNHV